MDSSRESKDGLDEKQVAWGADKIVGSGELADLIRRHDWRSTSLGPIKDWSTELVTLVNLTVNSPSPTRLLWGPELLLIYNDAYRPIPGPRHPAALGEPAGEVYHESWGVIGPVLERAYAHGETVYRERLLVPLPTRDGVRDFYLNYAFAPVFENGKIAGLFGTLQDVTREVTAVRELQESEARATRVLDSIGDAVIVTDAEACVTRMNPVAERLTGWKVDEARGRALPEVFAIVNEATRQVVESPTEKVKETLAVAGLANHTVLISRTGKETPIDDSGAPVFDEGGELAGTVLVFRDIEQRRRSELEKDRVTEQLSQVLAVTSDAVVSVDRDWTMTYLNPQASAIYEADRKVLGRNVWEAFPGSVYEGSPFVEHYYMAMNEKVAGKFEAHYAEPLNLWLRIEVFPTADGIVVFSRDISEEKAAEENLRTKSVETERQRAEIEAIYRTAPVGLALFDSKDYRYLRLNNRQAEFFGLEPEKIVGRTLTEMAPIAGLKELFDGVAAGTPVVSYPLEGTLITNPDEKRYWTVSYFPVFGADGSIQAITAASLEVTHQRKAEAALIQSEKLAVVGRLAASIAHEINNPLESVTNLLYLAEMSQDLGDIKGFLQTAERELRRVSAITNQTLRFHKQSTSPQAITCEELMKSVLSMYQSRIVNAGIRIELRHRAKRPVRCFEGEIRQVLSNLVINAIDAMQGESGRLFLRDREGTCWKTGERGVIFTIADTGGGMPEMVQGKLFEPFYTTKGTAGTGLGLWVSSEIVHRHRGELWFRSRVGVGTVFAIFLPFEAALRSGV